MPHRVGSRELLWNCACRIDHVIFDWERFGELHVCLATIAWQVRSKKGSALGLTGQALAARRSTKGRPDLTSQQLNESETDKDG